MDMLDRKALAGFRILIAVARADGSISAAELDTIRGVLGSRVPILEALLAEEFDLDEEIALLDDEAYRLRVYNSAYALAHVDGYAHSQEVNVLEKLIPYKGEGSVLAEVLGEAKDTLMPSNIVAIADPSKRDAEVREDMFKYSALAAVAGAMPIPGVGIIADLFVVGIQAKLVRDIGQYYGHTVDDQAARSLLVSVAGATGLRIAVNNLTRLVPGFGSAVGAASSFATTWAVGEVACRYFESGQSLDEAALKNLFEQARQSGKGVYTEQEARVAAVRAEHGDDIALLNERLATGGIDKDEYDTRVRELVG